MNGEGGLSELSQRREQSQAMGVRKSSLNTMRVENWTYDHVLINFAIAAVSEKSEQYPAQRNTMRMAA